MQKGFYVDETKCIKCHACEIACKLWNNLDDTTYWRQVVKVGTGGYPYVRKINVSLACMHCGQPKCVAACPVRAISKRVTDGIVLVDRNKCIGCGFCIWACPFNAPQIGPDGKMGKCTFCMDRPDGMPRACEEVCPTNAIRTGTMQELGRIAKEEAAARILTEGDSSLFLKLG